MRQSGLQGVSAATLATLHAEAIRLSKWSSASFGAGWREGLEGPAHVAATIAATHVTTRLMEAMSWLLAAQAVVAGDTRDPGPARWHSSQQLATTSLSKQRAELARAVDALYRQVIALDAEARS